MNCPFCDTGKEKTRIIKEGKYCYVCFSDPRLMKGHLLVNSKRHVEKLSELTNEEREEIISMVVKYQEKLLNVARGCDIRQNYRPFQIEDNLKVDHLHIHLQPRKFNDDLYLKCQIHEKDIFKSLTQEEVDKISKLLK